MFSSQLKLQSLSYIKRQRGFGKKVHIKQKSMLTSLETIKGFKRNILQAKYLCYSLKLKNNMSLAMGQAS